MVVRVRLRVVAVPGFESRTIELTEGSKVVVRPIVPGDEPLLHEAVAAMSERTVYFRFFSPMKRMSDALAHRLAVVDYNDRFALVATTTKPANKERIVGVARYDRIPNTEVAETAVAVIDEYQRRGLGSALLSILGKVARDHGITTFTLIVRDISDRRRAEAELEHQAEALAKTMSELTALNTELADRQVELERAMAARSRFYASMSHELRTPINAVLGYSTLLLEGIYGPLNEKQVEGITRTHRAAKHLLELVNDVLDLSKIEAGKIDLRLQPVSFPALVEDLFVTVKPLADQYGSTLSIEHDGDPVKVMSDPRRLRQILLNLLSNAIKFGQAKPIRVRSLPTADGGIVLEVIDQGDGIAPADREKIFDEFVQLGKTQLTEGTGLGLPISRRLAEMLFGTLEMESTIGAGSTVRLTLPATAEPQAHGQAPRPIAE